MGPLSCSTWNKAKLSPLVDSLAMGLSQIALDRQLKEHRVQRDSGIKIEACVAILLGNAPQSGFRM